MRGVKGGGESVILLGDAVEDNGLSIYQLCGECGVSGQWITTGNAKRGELI